MANRFRYSLIPVLLAAAVLLQGIAVADHVHLSFDSELECQICGSATGDGLLHGELNAPVVSPHVLVYVPLSGDAPSAPIRSFQSRAPPISV